MKIPEKIFELPLYHRFIFVPKNCSFYSAPGYQISGSIKSVDRAYKIAVEMFKRDYPDFSEMCAVFYGHVDDSCEEKACFYTIKKFKKRFRLNAGDL